MKLWCAILWPVLAFAQKAGSVEGVVLNAVTHAPVRRAEVVLASATRNVSYLGISDEAGQFQISNVEPGAYLVRTAKAQGYWYQRMDRRLSTAILAVGDEQHVRGVRVALQPFGAISGKVADEDGEPLRKVLVFPMGYDYSVSGRSLTTKGGGTYTDDRGEYRLFDLKPGKYFVRAWLPTRGMQAQGGEQAEPPLPNTHTGGPELGFAPVFYPNGTEAAQAQPVQVSGGGDLSGINFKLRPVPVYHVRGKLDNGAPENSTVMVGTCAEPLGQDNAAFPTALQPDGRFDVAGVLPGAYCVRLLSSHMSAAVFAKEAVVVTDHDVNGLVLRTAPLGAVSGVVEVEGQPENHPAVRVIVEQGSGGYRRSMSDSVKDGKFSFQGLFLDATEVVVDGLPAGMYLKSLYYGKDEIPGGSVPLRDDGSIVKLVLGADGGQLSGTVEMGNGDPAIEMDVTVAPADDLATRRDLVRSVTTDFAGHFEVKDLAPGEYKVYAWDDPDVPMAVWSEFRREFSGQAVTVRAGGQATVQVKAIPAEDIRRAVARSQ